MSKRSFLPLALVLAFVLTAVALAPPALHAQARATISVDTPASQVYAGDTVTLSVRIDSLAPGTSINAFDLQLEYGPFFLKLLNAEAGQLLTNCGWEYFTSATFPPTTCPGGSCPDSKVHIVGLADRPSVPGSPSCFVDQPGELARLTFEVSSHDKPCNFPMIVWFQWDDCGDNMITLSTTLDTALVSNRVFQMGQEITANSPLPSSTGASDNCVISGLASGNTVRGIDFYSGGVIGACPQPLTSGASLRLLDGGYDNYIGGSAKVGLFLTDNATGSTFGSFEAYIKYDPSILTFMGVAWGKPAQCGWASYYYEVGTNANCGTLPCPDGLIHLVAFASDGFSTPGCYLDANDLIADLQFQVPFDSSLACKTTPIEFVWFKCGDNLFTVAPDEIQLTDQRNVFDPYGFSYPDTTSTFPSRAGRATTCATPSGPPVDFHSTVIAIPCSPFILDRGDINLNEVAYEIADFLMFTNYFVYGSNAFTSDPPRQVLSTEVNGDGLELTLSDLIYLSRVIVGDTFPAGSPPISAVDTALLVQDFSTHSVALQYPDSLSAIYLVFDGYVEPLGATFPNHYLGYDSDGNFTRVIIYPIPSGQFSTMRSLGSQNLFYYSGDGTLVGAEAAGDGVQDIHTEISLQGAQPCCIKRGNIDHDPSGQIDVSDAVYLINYMFAFGAEPPCLEEANVNGSAEGRIDVADLVELIEYMFRQGPNPPSCPSQTKSWRYIAKVANKAVVEGILTMSIDDPPFYAGEWFLTRVDTSAAVGPQVGQGSWTGDDSGGSLMIDMNTFKTSSQVNLNITNQADDVWIGTWEYLEGGAVINNGQVILEAL